MCFRHSHLTEETRSCLKEALRLNQMTFPSTHHFESMRILHKLSQLYFSRRLYKEARHWNKAASKMSYDVKPDLEARMLFLEINQDGKVIEGRIQRIEEARARAREEARRKEREEDMQALLLSGGHILNPRSNQVGERPRSAAVGLGNRKAKGGKSASKARRRPKSANTVHTRKKSRRPKSSCSKRPTSRNKQTKKRSIEPANHPSPRRC